LKNKWLALLRYNKEKLFMRETATNELPFPNINETSYGLFSRQTLLAHQSQNFHHM
jgi:hypothetical protein